ncbi:MAG: choice-of-anchor D domain-containing protein [Deltaproteobacteria bacterium]|nr:choice-of-anchor D domain-containing protein [Deltaproteobacteria bacterium]
MRIFSSVFSSRFAFFSLPLLAVLALSTFSVGCSDVQFIGRDIVRDAGPIGNLDGDTCIVDDDCESGRCVGGICTDDGCTTDDECLPNETCVFGQCIDNNDFACTTEQRPLLNISTLSIEFGEVSLGTEREEIITLENVGDCLLTIQDIGFLSDAPPGFSCEPCEITDFPQRIPPQRSVDVTVRYAPQAPGEVFTELQLQTDDVTAGDGDGVVNVDLHATYSGVPNVIIDPAELSFGIVPRGTERTHDITIRNEGSGNALLTVMQLFVQGETDFTIPDEFAAISPGTPLLLAPYNPDDPDTVIVVPVTLRPDSNGSPRDYAADLKLQVHYGDPTAAVYFSTHLSGTSLGPPQIQVSAEELVYQEEDGNAYPIGTVSYRQITIQNSGESQLEVELSLSDTSGDFSVSPSFVPPIAAGGVVVLSVFFNPSQPSDPANEHDPTVPSNAFLNITSNDDSPAADVLKVVNLRGWARGGVYDDVLKLEMEFENADNSWAGSDYRDVDLEMISPTGFSCGKPEYQYAPDGNGGYIVVATEDPCDTWNAYDSDGDGRAEEGTANWLAVGQYQEPERIILFGLGPDLANGETFTARIHYAEDCENIPSNLLGDILGIGASVLLGVLGGAVGVPIAVPPGQISDMISENCWDHSSSNTTLHVFLNGEEVASPAHRLRNKGDYFDILRLLRENGQFVIQ